MHHGLTLPAGAVSGIKGGWIAMTHTYPSEMAQNFWTAIWAWSLELPPEAPVEEDLDITAW